ncbi:MAG: glycine/sarcosine/betaine reductase component B subunit [Deltaproteobacteria bacterium]
MRLEMAEFPVTDIRLGTKFRYHSGNLEVDAEELKEFVLQDKRIKEARIEIVVPGEKVRVTGVRDVVEPRVKVDGKGQVFPGILGPVIRVGEGRTNRLSGMAVVAAAEYEGIIRSGTDMERSAILDMWGPGAEASRFSALVNLVLTIKLIEGLAELEAHTVIQQAELGVAKRLAEATLGLKPEKNVEVYDVSKEEQSLPRVVLIQGCMTEADSPHSGVSYYGLAVRESLATLIHPNELLDGAVGVNCTRGVCHHPTTWDWQNHPLALGLFREHGRRLNFAGVVLERIRFVTHHGKEVIALNTAQLAATLRADGALVTWLGGGNAFVDVMLTIQACEQRGIKTVLVGYESGVKGGDAPLLYYVPEASAVVSTGSRNSPIELPAPNRVIGAYENIQILNYPGAPVVPAQDPVTLDAWDMVIGGVDIWGMQSWSCKDY